MKKLLTLIPVALLAVSCITSKEYGAEDEFVPPTGAIGAWTAKARMVSVRTDTLDNIGFTTRSYAPTNTSQSFYEWLDDTWLSLVDTNDYVQNGGVVLTTTQYGAPLVRTNDYYENGGLVLTTNQLSDNGGLIITTNNLDLFVQITNSVDEGGIVLTTNQYGNPLVLTNDYFSNGGLVLTTNELDFTGGNIVTTNDLNSYVITNVPGLTGAGLDQTASWTITNAASVWTTDDVDLASPPYFNVIVANVGVTQYLTSAVADRIWFNSVDFTNDTGWVSASNMYSAPVAGKYFMTANIKLSYVAVSNTAKISLRKNGGVLYEHSHVSANDVDSPSLNVSGLLHLDAGDYVEIFGYHNDGTTNICSGGQWSGYYVGR